MDENRPPDQPSSPLPKDKNNFDPENLIRTVISVPLLRKIEVDPSGLEYVIIDLNLRYKEGRDQAKDKILQLIDQAIQGAGDAGVQQSFNRSKSEASPQYIYARLQGKV